MGLKKLKHLLPKKQNQHIYDSVLELEFSNFLLIPCMSGLSAGGFLQGVTTSKLLAGIGSGLLCCPITKCYHKINIL